MRDQAKETFKVKPARAESNAGLQFVNISANVSREEKQRNQRMVRSAAMKSFRKQQKSQKIKEKVQKGDLTSRESTVSASSGEGPTPKSMRNHVTRESSQSSIDGPTIITEPDACLKDPWDSDDLTHLTVERELDIVTEQDFTGIRSTGALVPHDSLFHHALSINFLGAGRADPFQHFDKVAGPNASELIDHSLSILWPGFRPRTSPVSGTSLATAWHRKVHERPIVMHAMLFGATVHLEVLRSPGMALHNPLRLHHKLETMRLLRTELTLPVEEQAPLDEIILAVLSLGTNEVETMALNGGLEDLVKPFNSPLSGVQWLDVYGRIAHVKEHTKAMRLLVEKRGGLESIELDGLAEVLSFSDILGATQTLQKPHWPPLQRTASFAVSAKPSTIIPRFQLQNLGNAFSALAPAVLNVEAIKVYQAIADLTIIIDNHSHGSYPLWDFRNSIDLRNTVQHSLMSLRAGSELEEGEIEIPWLYEGIRWAVVVYSIAVTFPLPPNTGIFFTLAEKLQETLSPHVPLVLFFQDPFEHPKSLLWVLMLGAISSRGSSYHEWYLLNLVLVVEAMGLKGWDEILHVLREYLWVDCACEEGGRYVWNEVWQRISQQTG